MTMDSIILDREPQAHEAPLLPVAALTRQDPVHDVDAAVDCAVRRLAPLWSLRSYVAVNPFMGLADMPFAAAAELIAQRAGASLTAPRAFYAEAIRTGRITRDDLAAAVAERPAVPGAPADISALAAFAMQDAPAPVWETLPTVAESARQVTEHDWSRFITESISRWAAAHFDQGQAYWKSPWRHLSPYAAWRAEAAIDRTPEVAGIHGFRRTVCRLPESAAETIAMALQQIDVPPAGLEAYLHRLLMTIGGWAGYARYHLWEAELRDLPDSTVEELLAIRLVWEVALLDAFGAAGLNSAWAVRKEDLTAAEMAPDAVAVLAGELMLQNAFDKAYQRQLMEMLEHAQPAPAPARPRAQAAFCIDVRSEVFRRALESVDAQIETIGFAGFFGFPIEYVRLGETHGSAQCPVLLTPQFVINESVPGVTSAAEDEIREQRTLRQRAAKVWRSFKFGAVSCFGFVGPVGLAYVKNLIGDTLGKSRPVALPTTFGLDRTVAARLSPSLARQERNGRLVGMSIAQQLEVAEGVLKAMSLTEDFARLVLLVGHGSTTVNNPYASGLECGACGGHAGEANARVAALVLNDPEVRAGLGQRGILIPEETIFIAGQHDTTTDQVMLFDTEQLPSSHAVDVAQIKADLAAAGHLARAERAPLLHVKPESNVDAAVVGRSRDWSQVRPEWGLAGCAAFIVAPRRLTMGLDLQGRSFLHSYEWRQDEDFGVLELIMTAPMVVASWINLQYFASTVDNRVFGSGNKTLHNVVGTLGVLEGNGGDLRVGLPWQSVHDGEKYIHEPVRLNVMIAAPPAAMTDVIARHEGVRRLLDNEWIYLFALDDHGRVSHQYSGDLTWTPA